MELIGASGLGGGHRHHSIPLASILSHPGEEILRSQADPTIMATAVA
jgi:hypothetical protein